MSTPVSAGLHGGGTLTALPGGNELTFFPVTGNYDAVADPSISGVLNSPVIQPVNALVNFTPRLQVGQLIYISNYLVTPAYNAEQTVNIIGNATGGTFPLSYAGYTTTQLAWNATPSQVQTALEALPSIGSGNVHVVADVEPQAYDVEFMGALGSQPIPLLVGDASLLSNIEGEGFCEITVTATTLGTPQVVADTAIALPTLQARIFSGVLSTIDRVDTPGFQLVANSAVLELGGDLIYDVSFTNVTYNGASQVIAPFAFTAPTDPTPVSLTSPTLVRLPYLAPSDKLYSPPAVSLVGGRNWRQRTA